MNVVLDDVAFLKVLQQGQYRCLSLREEWASNCFWNWMYSAWDKGGATSPSTPCPNGRSLLQVSITLWRAIGPDCTMMLWRTSFGKREKRSVPLAGGMLGSLVGILVLTELEARAWYLRWLRRATRRAIVRTAACRLLRCIGSLIHGLGSRWPEALSTNIPTPWRFSTYTGPPAPSTLPLAVTWSPLTLPRIWLWPDILSVASIQCWLQVNLCIEVKGSWY